MKIEHGGQSTSIRGKIESIEVYHEVERSIRMMINGSSLSYLSIEEALNLRDELNAAIELATGLKPQQP